MINLYSQEPKPNLELPKKAGGKKANYQKFTDATGEFTSKELKYSFWYVRHKVLLYRLLVIFLVGFSVATLAYSLWYLGNYAISGYGQDKILEQQSAQFLNYTGIQSHYAPTPLTVLSSGALPGGVNKFDVVSEMANPNKAFIAKFDYSFMVDGVATPAEEATLLPGEDRPVAYLGLDGSGAGSIQPILTNITWKRVSAKLTTDPRAWQADRLNFSADKFVFTPAGPSAANANIIRFTLSNNSAYGYKNPNFYVGLYFNGILQQLLPLQPGDMPSLSSAAVDLRSFVANLQADEVRIFPLINVYDDTVYLPPPR